MRRQTAHGSQNRQARKANVTIVWQTAIAGHPSTAIIKANIGHKPADKASSYTNTPHRFPFRKPADMVSEGSIVPQKTLRSHNRPKRGTPPQPHQYKYKKQTPLYIYAKEVWQILPSNSTISALSQEKQYQFTTPNLPQPFCQYLFLLELTIKWLTFSQWQRPRSSPAGASAKPQPPSTSKVAGDKRGRSGNINHRLYQPIFALLNNTQ